MDVTGTRFHLIQGKADWEQCLEDGSKAFSGWQNAVWEARRDAMTLRPALNLFRHLAISPLAPETRRGAARDAFGNQFWISENRQEVWWNPAADNAPVRFWMQSAEAPVISNDRFQVCIPPLPETPFTLAGMAVTVHQYLVVGYLGASSAEEKGVLLFDLRAGGPPTRLVFPEEAAFVPFDMTADASGNVWILDRVNRAYWGLDREFRLLGSEAAPSAAPEPPAFEPVVPEADVPQVQPSTPVKGFAIEAVSAVGIKALPDGSLLILDTPAALTASRLYRYSLADRIGAPLDLVAQVDVITEGTNQTADHLDVRGYDLAYLAETPERGTLFVVEEDGNQAIAFLADFSTPIVPSRFGTLTLTAEPTYLPLHYFGGRALFAQGEEVYYDVTAGAERDKTTRWVTLQAIEQPRYDLEAVLDTPVFDGKTQECVWHRLFLDACLPSDAGVTVATRAANSLTLLNAMPFTLEPRPYRRSRGAEIPYYQPFPGNTDPEIGTYETLFQQAQGQYLQIRLTLTGSGRVTPVLYRLRAYYPRFSYPRHYLPSVYLEDAESLSFLERFLANTEGFYSEIEGKIENVSALFDGRSAPPETLDWLAGWMGLLLDPIWESLQQRRNTPMGRSLAMRALNQSGLCPPADRRRLLLRFARHLYQRRGTLEGLNFALHLLLDASLETLLAQLKEIAVLPEAVRADPKGVENLPRIGLLAREINRLGLTLPTPATSEVELEDMLYELIVASLRPSPIRIVERFRTHPGRAAVEGDTSGTSEGSADTDLSPSDWAHRFSVLIPQGRLPEEEAMVRRIVHLEKPAHTQFDVRYYAEGFRVGGARLGLDTILGETPNYPPILLGRSVLPEGYLGARPPMDASDRVIADLDRVGEMPPL